MKIASWSTSAKSLLSVVVLSVALPVQAQMIPQEEFTGVITQVMPGALELKTRAGKRMFRIPEAKRKELSTIGPGDRITVFFECEARELRVLQRASKKQRSGRAPKTIIDDRAFYGAKNAPTKPFKPQG